MVESTPINPERTQDAEETARRRHIDWVLNQLPEPDGSNEPKPEKPHDTTD